MKQIDRRAPALDLARLVAAAAVFCFHDLYLMPGTDLLPWRSSISHVAQYGYLGVQFFFMLSGYVIVMSAEKSNYFTFARDRLARLLPAFAVCLILTTSARFYAGSPPSIASVIANFTLEARALRFPYVDDVYWSLSAEMLFYILVWLLLLGDNFRKRARLFLVIWAALALTGVKGPIGVVLNLSWAPYFCVGITAYLWRSERKKVDGLLFAAFVIFAALTAAHQAQSIGSGLHDRPSPLWVGFAVAIIGSLIIVLPAINFNSGWARFATVAGAISYPFYLLHNEFARPFFKAAWPNEAALLIVNVGLIFICYAVTVIEKGPRKWIHAIAPRVITHPLH